MKTQSPEQNTGRLRFRSAWLALLLLPLGASSLHAQWTGAAADGNYTNPLNWTDGDINGVFTGTIGLTAATSILVDSGTDFTNGLTFTYVDPYGITLVPSSGGDTYTLDGNVTDDTGPTSGKGETINIGVPSRIGTLDLDGGVRTFQIDYTTYGSTDTLQLQGLAVNDGTILKQGVGLLSFGQGVTVDPTVDLILNGGVTQAANNATLVNASGLTITGYSLFRMYANTTQNVAAAMPIELENGILGVYNGVASAATTFDSITLGGGREDIQVGNTTGTLTINNLVRNNDALLNLGGLYTTGGTSVPQIVVTNNASLLSGLVGGGGAAGTTTVSILPWVFGSTNPGSGNGEVQDNSGATSYGGLVTYDPTTGFRLLTASEYLTNSFATAGTYDNVMENSETTLTPGTPGAMTINSLWLAGIPSGTANIDGGSATYTLAAGTVLTITSGDLLSEGTIAGGALNPGNTLTGGTIEAGAGNPLIINSGRASAFTINSQISGDAGIIDANLVTLTNTNNNYTGPTVIIGTLVTSGNEVIPNASPVIVNSGGIFHIGNNNNATTETIASLSGSGSVVFQIAADQLNIGSLTGLNAGIQGYVTVNSGGFISPGDASGAYQANALTVGANISGMVFQPGSALYLDLASTTSFDSLVFTGTAANAFINGGTLYINLLNGYVPTSGTTFTSIVGTTAGSGTGFDSIVDSSNGADGLTWTLTADGNDWVLTASAIPEPATYALLLGALALVATVSRRRKT